MSRYLIGRWIFLAGLLGAAMGFRRLAPTRFVVADGSMMPTLEPGDRLLVVHKQAQPGDVVILRDPEVDGRFLVKRVVRTDGSACWVQGDNGAESRDSRAFGFIPAASIVGCAVWIYLPGKRRGILRSITPGGLNSESSPHLGESSVPAGRIGFQPRSDQK